MEATPKSAAIAGAWTSFWLVPFEAWMEHHKSMSALSHNLLLFGAAVAFFFMPVYFLVLGRGNEPFRRTWFLHAEERARHGVVFRRMLVWFVSAGSFGAVWSMTLGFVVGKISGP